MSDTLRFKKIGDWGKVESEYFIFTKEEIIAFFKDHTPLNDNVFKKIEKHQFIPLSLSEDTRFQYFFQPKKESDKYVLFMIKPEKEEPKILHKLMSFLLVKESKDLNKSNDSPWIETWHLRP